MTEQEFATKQVEILASVPKAFRGWLSHKAWEDGHAYGYEEVLSHLDDLTSGLKECLGKDDTPESTYDHLTPEQKTEIVDAAIMSAVDNAQHDGNFLRDVVSKHVHSMNVEEQVKQVECDPDMLHFFLNFDPTTGKEWDIT